MTHQIQLPVLTNLAACQIALEKWRQAEQICSQAIDVDPDHVKALGRRAQSRVRLGMLKAAREDLEHAKEVLWKEESGEGQQDESNTRKVPSSLVSLERTVRAAEAKYREGRKKRKQAVKKMANAGGIYAEKKNITRITERYADRQRAKASSQECADPGVDEKEGEKQQDQRVSELMAMYDNSSPSLLRSVYNIFMNVCVVLPFSVVSRGSAYVGSCLQCCKSKSKSKIQ